MISRELIVGALLAQNAFAYSLMCLDKYRAKRRGRRIPELVLFAVAWAFGSVGIYLGMGRPLYHKASKTSFRFGIPALILIHTVLIFFLMI